MERRFAKNWRNTSRRGINSLYLSLLY